MLEQHQHIYYLYIYQTVSQYWDGRKVHFYILQSRFADLSLIDQPTLE